MVIDGHNGTLCIFGILALFRMYSVGAYSVYTARALCLCALIIAKSQ